MKSSIFFFLPFFVFPFFLLTLQHLLSGVGFVESEHQDDWAGSFGRGSVLGLDSRLAMVKACGPPPIINTSTVTIWNEDTDGNTDPAIKQRPLGIDLFYTFLVKKNPIKIKVWVKPPQNIQHLINHKITKKIHYLV